MTAFTNDRRVTSLLKDAQNSLMTSSSFKPRNKVSFQESPGTRSRSLHRKHFTSDKRKYFHLCNNSDKHKTYQICVLPGHLKKSTQNILVFKDTDVFYTAYTKSQVNQTGLTIRKSQIKGKSLY